MVTGVEPAQECGASKPNTPDPGLPNRCFYRPAPPSQFKRRVIRITSNYSPLAHLFPSAFSTKVPDRLFCTYLLFSSLRYIPIRASAMDLLACIKTESLENGEGVMSKIIPPRAKPFAAVKKYPDGSEVIHAYFFSRFGCLNWIRKQRKPIAKEWMWYVGEFPEFCTERNNEA